MSDSKKARPRPLLARPNATFTCFSDGLCCTDIHALGPLTRAEVKDMRTLAPDSVEYNEDAEDMCLATRAGGCHFLRDGKCSIHAQRGPEAKPTGCRRFPYGLVSTPDGGRVTTEHRCPCRTLGERPPIDLQDADVSLRDRAGRLEVDQVVPQRMPINRKKRITWEAYCELESALLSRLHAGEKAEDVLDSRPLPTLSEGDWPVFAAEFFGMADGTAGGVALGYFGDALLHVSAGHLPPERPRPWAPAFERASARTRTPLEPERMYNDWVADELWMLRYLEWGALDRGRAELSTRLLVARTLQARFEGIGVRCDQAVAEALMCVDIATASSEWPCAVEAIAL